MKLLNKSSAYYMLILLPIFIFMGVAFYHSMIWVIIEQTDEHLIEDKFYISQQLGTSSEIRRLDLNLSDEYHLREANQVREKDEFLTVTLFDEFYDEDHKYRQLITTIEQDGTIYELTIRKSLVEYELVVYSVASVGAAVMVILALIILTVNRVLSKRIWAPFYKTLSKLRSFNSDDNEILGLYCVFTLWEYNKIVFS